MGRINANTEVKNIPKISPILGLSEKPSSDSEKAYIAFKYFDKSFECLSEWDKHELSSLTDLFETVSRTYLDTIKKS